MIEQLVLRMTNDKNHDVRNLAISAQNKMDQMVSSDSNNSDILEKDRIAQENEITELERDDTTTFNNDSEIRFHSNFLLKKPPTVRREYQIKNSNNNSSNWFGMSMVRVLLVEEEEPDDSSDALRSDKTVDEVPDGAGVQEQREPGGVAAEE